LSGSKRLSVATFAVFFINLSLQRSRQCVVIVQDMAVRISKGLIQVLESNMTHHCRPTCEAHYVKPMALYTKMNALCDW